MKTAAAAMKKEQRYTLSQRIKAPTMNTSPFKTFDMGKELLRH